MKINETEQRVYYSDTDHAGAVYYSNYFKWFEIGRTEFLRQLGFDYADFEKQGLIVPVVEAHCDYQSPARYSDIVTIRTKISNIGTSSIKFDYEVIDKSNNKLLAQGRTTNVFVDTKTMKPASIPGALKKSLQG
jgi:acyl-CoA thioester hydrolase